MLMNFFKVDQKYIRNRYITMNDTMVPLSNSGCAHYGTLKEIFVPTGRVGDSHRRSKTRMKWRQQTVNGREAMTGGETALAGVARGGQRGPSPYPLLHKTVKNP